MMWAMGRLPRAAVLACLALLVCAWPARAAAPPGKLESRTYATGYRSLIYTPASLDRSKPAPVWVMLHGCGNTAEDMSASYGLNELGERHGFVVLYPDGDPAQHPSRCWRSTSDIVAGSPEPAAITTMVNDLIARGDPPVDGERIYLAGHSSGAMMASVLAATYPNVYAAVLIDAGCAYGATTCIGLPPVIPSSLLAQGARSAMGQNARVVPILNVHGDRDPTVPIRHSQQVIDQWRMTNNLVAGGTLAGPISAKPSTARSVPASGLTSTVETYDDAEGCPILERWVVHGLDHRWPGGDSAPAGTKFTDKRGPDGGENAWAFFSRFRLSGPVKPCTPAAPPPAACRGVKTVTIHLPRGARAVRVLVAGKRRQPRRSGRALRISLAGLPAGRVRVVVTARVGKRSYTRTLRRTVCA